MDLSTNTKFRHILAQKGQPNNIKVVKHGKKQGDIARKAIRHARKQDKARDIPWKANKHVIKQDKAKGVDCS